MMIWHRTQWSRVPIINYLLTCKRVKAGGERGCGIGLISIHIVHLGQFITIECVCACIQRRSRLFSVRAMVVRQTRNKDTNAMLCELRNVKGTCIFSISTQINFNDIKGGEKKAETTHTFNRTFRLINTFGNDTQPFHLILSSWPCTHRATHSIRSHFPSHSIKIYAQRQQHKIYLLVADYRAFVSS